MKGRRFLTPWLASGIQAGLIAGLLACATVLAFLFARPAPRLTLPNGVDGALVLVPAVVALGIFAISGPVFMSATRTDAILGALAAFMIAADVLMAFSVILGISIWIHPLSRSLPLGTVGAIIAIPVGLVGLVAGQATAAFGFGKTAGIRSAVAGMPLAIVVSLVVAYWV